MATIGLRVQDSADGGSSLSLADTLAKGIFGDPEGQMKARALAAQVAAHQAYATKLGADTGLVNVKTREEQALADAQDAAANSPDALLAAIPSPARPIPVETSRANAPGTTGYGPQPGIVTPDAQATYDAAVRMHDAQAETLRKLWPVIVRTGNATQVIEALGKGEGLAGLSGGLVPGAKVDPNVQRVAGGLYTGSAPTTSTVWSPGDVAGVDAEARGKILEERGKPKTPILRDINGGLVSVDPTGAVATPVQGAEPQPKAPERQVIDGAVYERDPATGKWSPAPGIAALPKAPERQVVDGVVYERGPDGKWAPAAGIASPPPKIINVGKNETPMIQNPDGSLSPAPGVPTKPDTGPYGDISSVSGVDNQIVNTVANKLANNQPITPDEARSYDQSWNNLFGAKTEIQIINGVKTPVTIQPSVPTRFPSPDQAYTKAGVAPPPPPVQSSAPPVQSGGPPVQSGGPPVQNAGPVVVGTPLEKPVPKPLTAEQEKARTYLVMGSDANDILTKLDPKTVPSGLDIWLAQTGGAPGPVSSVVGSLASDQAKQYAGAASAFIEAYARPATGATISPKDYQNFYSAMIPLPTDPQSEIDRKTRIRANLVKVWESGGFPDDASRDAWLADQVRSSKSTPPKSDDTSKPKRRVYDANGNLQ
jgi:hypothetical protein